MSHLDRILDDGTDRDRWLALHDSTVTASTVAKLSKLESVPLYLADMLTPRTFTGNRHTESGHRWEPMMLAWAGIPENKALIHSPDEKGFAATPDGISVDGTSGAEAKAKHGRIITGPSLGEWRQLAFQFLCVPEFETIKFIWVELIDGEIRDGRNGEPSSITIPRDDPKILEVTAHVVPIATDLLARLRIARSYERSAA